MKKILFIVLLISSHILTAQSSATLKGLLTDKEVDNESLPFANVLVKGTNIGTTTDFDGKYEIKVPAGNHIVVFSFLGYKTIEKPFSIKEGETLTINQIMSAEEGVSLDEIVVKSKANREEICIICNVDSHYSMDKAANLLSLTISSNVYSLRRVLFLYE
mgnify:CR=1 FL=1